MQTEYYIEIRPGKELEQKIQMTKDALIARLGPAVDDPTQTMFLRDAPHFTMQVARATDFVGVLDAYRKVAAKFSGFEYTIDNVGRAIKGGLTEVHVIPDSPSQRRFLAVHEALLDASIPFLAAELPAMYRGAAMDGLAAENLRKYHFPFAKALYKAHASVGRFNDGVLTRVDNILAGFDPCGTYRTGQMCIWKYVPGDVRYSIYDPILIEWGGEK
jgi:hypothetical protein